MPSKGGILPPLPPTLKSCGKITRQAFEIAAIFHVTLPTGLVVQLRWRRQHLRLRQKDLAARVGVSANQVGKWERRQADPGLSHFVVWCEELGFAVSLRQASTPSEPRPSLCAVLQ